MEENFALNAQSKINNISQKLEQIIEKKSVENSQIGILEKKIHKIENFISEYSNEKFLQNSNSNKALDYFVRSGEISTEFSCKSLNSSAHSAGALIQHDLYFTIMERVSIKSVLRNFASVENISGSYLEIVQEVGNFNSGWVDESDERNITDNAKLVKQKIFLHEIYAQPKATQRLIDDSFIDLDEWIKNNIIDSFIKLENEAFIHGNGDKKPFGILHYKNDPLVQHVQINSEITADSLLAMINSLEENFLANACFLLNRLTLSKIQSLKDNNGRFIWQHSFSDSLTQSILGIPVVCCSNMPNIEQGEVAIVLADFKAAYKILDRAEISLVRDPYTEKPFVKFYSVKRVGGDVVNKQALVFGQVI